MALPTQAQLGTILKGAVPHVVTVTTIFAVLSLMTPEQSAAFLSALREFNDSIVTAYGALTKMLLIAGPVALTILARIGLKDSSVSGLVAKLMGLAQGNTAQAAEAQKGLVDATTAIVNSTAQTATTEVKAAILNAAVSMPEVATPKILVTDKALAAATPNDNVVAAPNAT